MGIIKKYLQERCIGKKRNANISHLVDSVIVHDLFKIGYHRNLFTRNMHWYKKECKRFTYIYNMYQNTTFLKVSIIET